MIRAYKSDDTDALVLLWQAASGIAHPFLSTGFTECEAENLRKLYLPNAQTWVTEESNEPIGFIAMIDDEIGGLFVHPSFHKAGYGKAMVDHVVGIRGTLCVQVFEKNTIGRRFYDRYGFAETARYKHEPTGEMMIKMAMATR